MKFYPSIGPDLRTNHLSRGSPLSKSLKHPSLALEDIQKQPQRRSVPNVLEDVETMRRLGELYESFDRKRALVKYQSQSEVIKVML